MKKITLLSCCMLFVLGMYAQEGLKIGLRFHPIISFTTVTDDNGNKPQNRDNSARLGWSYGITGSYGITENYAFYTGIHIVNKGFNEVYDAEPALPASDQNIRITSIEVPIAAQLRTNEIGTGLYFKGLFGVSIDFNVGYRNNYDDLDPFDLTPESGTIRDTKKINPLALTFIVGPAFDLETNFGTLGFGLTYHQGLTNINNKSNVGNDNKIRINYVSLDALYYF